MLAVMRCETTSKFFKSRAKVALATVKASVV
nr:MAG TPA: hypothetical protein [Caudoviricetes sp.]